MEKNRSILRNAYGIFLSVFTVAVGILFIVQSQRIYRSAEISPYTYEKAAKALSQIAVPVVLWLISIVGGGIIFGLFPAPAQKTKATVDPEKLLSRLKNRLTPEAKYLLPQKNTTVKKIVWSVCITFCLVSAVMVGLCVWNKDNYTPIGNNFNPTRDMLAMLPKILPWVIISFLLAIGATVYSEQSAKMEINEVKKLLSVPVNRAKTPACEEKQFFALPNFVRTKEFSYAVRGCLFVVGTVFIVWGCFNGGVLDVLQKAINICTECIGLG